MMGDWEMGVDGGVDDGCGWRRGRDVRFCMASMAESLQWAAWLGDRAGAGAVTVTVVLLLLPLDVTAYQAARIPTLW